MRQMTLLVLVLFGTISGAPMRAEFKALKLRRLSKEQGQHVLQQFASTKQTPAALVELIQTNGIPGLVQNLS